LFIQGGERVVFNDAAIALGLNGNAGITEALFLEKNLYVTKIMLALGLAF